MNHKPYLSCLLIAALLLAGCGPTAASTATDLPPATALPPAIATATVELPPAAPSPTSAPPTATHTAIPPTETLQPPTPTAEPGLPPLPPEPQRIEFQAEDGTLLVGYYYPAAVNPAPVVVLMHWAGGDQTDWLYVGMASWLQNRGAEIPAPPAPGYFDTPYPFAPLPEDLSFGVFTFNFRGYGESGPHNGPQSDLVMDARAAYLTAAALSGVDSARVVGIGASIGADGVVDGCNEACLGALSLGPGHWLEMSYSEAVKALDDLGKPVWCVAAEDDESGAQTCRAAAGDHYYTQVYPSGGHAMRLFRMENNLQPPIEAVILDFLRLVFGLPND
jgi:dienelactone hydrolase